MEDEKLNKNGLIKVWLKIWTLLKLLVGDVDVTGKGDLQTQINNIDNRVDKCFRNASDGKKLIADAVTGKGVPTLVSDTFATMAANIAKIRSSARLQGKTAVLSNVAQTIKPDADYDGLSQVSVPAVRGTAGTGDVLTGKTFSGAAGIEKAGTMPENGAWTGETTGNGNVPIPAGHHNGQGYVSGAGAYAKGMVDADARTNTNSANYKNGYNAGVTATKKGTAGTGDVLTGKTFTNASSVEAAGAMANKGAVTVDAGGVTQDDTYTYLAVPAAAFYNANSKLRTKNSNIRDMSGTFWLRDIGIKSRINFNTNKRWSKIDITQIDDRSQTDNNNPADGVQIIGDGTVIATIKDFTKHTYSISNYNVIQISVLSYHTYGTYRIY